MTGYFIYLKIKMTGYYKIKMTGYYKLKNQNDGIL